MCSGNNVLSKYALCTIRYHNTPGPFPSHAGELKPEASEMERYDTNDQCEDKVSDFFHELGLHLHTLNISLQ